MSIMGVLTYFLKFQIKQSERGILINQENDVNDVLKKYNINGLLVKTPMVPPNYLRHDLNSNATNEIQYRVVFKAPKLSFNVERVHQGIKPEAQPGHKKHLISSKQPTVSRGEETKSRSSTAPTDSKTGHCKKRKESSSTMDSNPSQTSVSTLVVTKIHKVDQQATGYDALAYSTAKVDSGLSAHNDSIPQQQGMDEGTTNTLFDHISAGASSIARQVEEKESSRRIKLEDLTKLVSNVQPSFKDLDSPEDDPVIVVDDSDEDEEDEVHTTNAKIEDTSVPKFSSHRSSQIQELTN
nr:hypothetical protein [Tanacetum cinerariifolium]